ncbi:MAG: LON peptidase substrate-binding domain-containing protein [Ekhidna sp.]|uniref:LON peptidase substrate-binding domain-containing protein n=1 Tax=Ekhidna sp. TaxID=2608089 RepID=UPI0032EFEC80
MKEIPLFPLNIVAFPGEAVNLHIFEPRYKALVNDCLNQQQTFGIPSFVLGKIELGTEVKIVEVTKKYEDGRMDIKTEAMGVFEVKDFWNPWGEHEYAGGRVSFLKGEEARADASLLYQFKEMSSRLFGWLGEVNVPDVSTISSVYDIGHKIGLKPEEEYRLLAIRDENERLRYAIRHLQNLIPALERAQSAQERIRQNGHFKHLDPLKF